MKTHVLRGSKQEIAERIVQISGVVRDAIVFEEEPALAEAKADHVEDVFAEMQPFMVDVQDVDDSREAIYVRMEDE